MGEAAADFVGAVAFLDEVFAEFDFEFVAAVGVVGGLGGGFGGAGVEGVVGGGVGGFGF